MDKYEYKLKTEQMLELMESGAYNKAAEIADTIDWKRVRNAAMLINVSDIYEKNGDYQKSYDVLNIAYHRAEGSRKVIYRLCALALKTGNVDEAIDYYDDFIQIAPKDPNQHILKYKIMRARRAPIDQQIEALEEFKKAEYIEEWAFELAKLYQEAGMTAECLEECDDLILWFSEGNYVYKAMELKLRYKQLTPSQQEKYDHRFDKIESATEEIPDLTQYQARKDNIEDKLGKSIIDETQQMFIPIDMTDEKIEDESSINDLSSVSEVDEVLPEPEDEVVKKLSEKGIGSTMKLEDALQSLLNPKSTVETENIAETDVDEDKEDIPELKTAIEEIESVIDLELVNELSGKNEKELAFDADLEELKAEPLDDSEISSVNGSEQEQLAEQELTETKEETINPEIAVKDEPERIEDTLSAENIILDKENPAESDQLEGQLSLEDILKSWDQTDEPAEEESMVEKEKKAEPILPPDIQRMIDEIEGVLPEEPEPEPMRVPDRIVVEPRENMGEITQQLRIDDIEAFLDEEEDADINEEELEEDEDLEDYFIEDDEEIEEDSYQDDELEEDLFEEDYDELEEDSYEEDYDELEEDSYEEDYDELEEDSYEEDYDELEEDSYEEDYDELEEDSYEEDYDELEEDSYEEDDDDFEEEYDEDEDDEDDLNKIEASFEEEFRINPEHADENDDREIPDDEDDNMDILSATTPLSRKETAKLIATGKTAPLPLDDISNALSMSDTGFIVHGRYDLETQSGIGTRAGLTDEQKKLFSYFVPVRGMSEQLVDVLEQDLNCTNRNGTSKTGNLLIIGNKGNGKTVLAVDIVKAIQKQRNIRQGKVAIVTGESLNKKKISDIISKLHGGALIIEKAGKLNEKTVARLNKAMERDTGEMLIVLEEQRKPLDRLLSSNREFRRKFTSRLEVPIFINDELVTFGQTYAQENGYRIDEMGILALYSRIDTLQREDHAVTVAEVKDVMDEAMEHSQKASAKKLVRRVFGKNTDDSDRIILSEKDFNI